MANIFRAGTSQRQRLLPTLKPDYFKVDDRSLEDLLQYLYVFSGLINYYNLTNTPEPGTAWQQFFHIDGLAPVGLTDTNFFTQLIKKIEQNRSNPPQLALLIAFLKLYRDYLQVDLNHIPKRHLDFYYGDVLRFKRRQATADQVHIIFQLAKNVTSQKIDPYTKLNAGKQNGKDILFQTNQELVVNHARIGGIKSLYIDKANGSKIYVAQAANSIDGKGTPFDDPIATWSLFGENQAGKNAGQRNMEAADIGFLIASPQFFLHTGARTIILDFYLKNEELSVPSLNQAFSFQYSAAAGWQEINVFQLQTGNILVAGQSVHFIQIKLELSPGLPSWVNFNVATHQDAISTPFPVLKVIFNAESGYYEIFKNLLIDWINIKVQVKGMRELIIGNDLGAVDPSKPFQPFGPSPKIGSSFFIGSSELFQKRLTRLSVGLVWQDVPEAELVRYYADYFIVRIENILRINNTSASPATSLQIMNHAQNIVNHFLSIGSTLSVAATVVLTGTPFADSAILAAITSQIAAIEISNTSFSAAIDRRSNNTWIPFEGHLTANGAIGYTTQSLFDQVDATRRNYILFDVFNYYIAAIKDVLHNNNSSSTPVSEEGLTAFSESILANYLNDGSLGTLSAATIQILTDTVLAGAFTPILTAISNINIDRGHFHSIPGADGTEYILNSPDYQRTPGLLIDRFDPNNVSTGYFRLSLNGPNTPGGPFSAFGHQAYPELYTQQIIKFSRFDPASTDPQPTLLKVPYTPLLKDVLISYESEELFRLNDANAIDQFFHLEPFGRRQMNAEDKGWMLPQYDAEGTFFLGLTGLKPPQTVSILFQLAEGSGDPLLALQPENIVWSYLANNNWIPFQSLEIVTNTTQALQASGITSFAIGKNATHEHTRMPNGLHWLKAEVAASINGVSKAIALHTQAVVATRVINDLDQPVTDQFVLPEESISKLITRNAAIKTIYQPYTSFAGKPIESEHHYYARVSERLRHKQRSIACWDYERMVLNEFPDIYKVKCLNHSSDTSDFAPGALSLVVVQNQISRNAVNPLEPKVSTSTLTKIKEFVGRHCSPHVSLFAQNPVYEQILLDFKVGFLPERDAGFYGNLLNEELIRFLSPWAFEEGQDIVIGGRVFRSELLNFIENREYVDFINEFQLYHIYEGPSPGGVGDMAIDIDFIVAGNPFIGIGKMEIDLDFIVGLDIEEAIATNPRAILVSFPKHRIKVLKPGEYVCRGSSFEGIGFMAVGIDFEVAAYPYAIGTMTIVPDSEGGDSTLLDLDNNYLNPVHPGDFVIADPNIPTPVDAAVKIGLQETLRGLFNPSVDRIQ